MSGAVIAALALSAGWMIAACALPFLRQHQRGTGFWLLICAGIPLAGWLTLRWGPGAGVLAVALAVILLTRPPVRRRGTRRQTT